MVVKAGINLFRSYRSLAFRRIQNAVEGAGVTLASTTFTDPVMLAHLLKYDM